MITMSRKKKPVDNSINESLTTWPKVTVGSHSTRTEYEDGRVDFVTDWEALKRDVQEAIADYERKKLVDEAPFHPGYEGAVVKQEKTRRTRKNTLK